jgi:hypothetical protein
MTKKLFLLAITAGILWCQSAADLLQKGIHAQETVGDVDGAIQIFRQVVNTPSAKRTLAAQAQYQLVVCMVQKGDRAAARKELDALLHNFPGEPDLVAKARKLVPGEEMFLPAPWGELEFSQLNLKRDGVATGDTLIYSVDPDSSIARAPISPFGRDPSYPNYPRGQVLRWELNAGKTTQSVKIELDRDTLVPVVNREVPREVDRYGPRPLGKSDSTEENPIIRSNDVLGDPIAAAISGPAVDVEQSIFLLRRLPLAVGFKTTLKSRPLTLASKVKSPVEVMVTGIEAVTTPAGKFNCYRLEMKGIGQTMWIGVEGARPLVKIQAGSVEAELVKVWTSNPIDEVVEQLTAAGWKAKVDRTPGVSSSARVSPPTDSDRYFYVAVRKFHTPKTEIAAALQKAMDRELNPGGTVRAGSPESLVIGGHQALRCVIDTQNSESYYILWIQTESALAKFTIDSRFGTSLGVARWELDPLLETIKVR